MIIRFYFICLLMLGFAALLPAQYQTKVAQENFPLKGSKKASLNLKFAHHILVKEWDKVELGLKTTITFSDPALAEKHKMEVDKSGESLEIETTYEWEKNKGNNFHCWNCNEPSQACVCLESSYEVYVPKGASLTLETISGDIEIINVGGDIRAKSISGWVDVSMNPRGAADLHFKSVTGEIYTDFDVKLDKNSSSFSKKLNTSINGGGSALALETVSGDIFFRKLN